MHLCLVHFINELQAVGIVTQEMKFIPAKDFRIREIS